jgi:hypothetical protein
MKKSKFAQSVTLNNLYLGAAHFESQLENQLSWLKFLPVTPFPPHKHQDSTTRSRQQPLPSKSSSIHQSTIILPSDTT